MTLLKQWTEIEKARDRLVRLLEDGETTEAAIADSEAELDGVDEDGELREEQYEPDNEL